MLEREVAAVTTKDVASRRAQIQEIYTRSNMWHAKLLVGAALGCGLLLAGVITHDSSAVMGVVGITSIITGVACLIMGIQFRRLSRHRVFVIGRTGNAESGCLAALDGLMQTIRDSGRDHKRLQKAADLAFDRLQELVPDMPLSNMKRYGYYPSRPEITENERRRIVDHDKDPIEEQWARTVKSINRLRGLLADQGVVLEKRVAEAVSEIVPPLRAVLRSAGVRTHRIEYIVMSALQKGAFPHESGSPAAIEEHGLGVMDKGDTRNEIDDRLNASARMAYVSLKALISSFHGAETALFMGDDRITGELIVDRHLPDLEAAFILADDAAQGEEKDAVRADFAKSLKLIASTLEGIMSRHAQVAHDLLRDKGRFLEQRHGNGDL